MLKKIFFLFFITFSITSYCAKKPLLYWSIALNNFVAAKPILGFSKVFYAQFNPGITISTGFNWKEKPKHNWMQSFKAAYFSHRFVQRSIMLYSEFGYRYKVGKWGFSTALGGGYLHMITATQQFAKNDNWETKNLKNQPQAMFSFSMGIDYKINKKGMRTFTRYQNILQTHFVKGYQPLLPYNVLHIGITIPVSVLKGDKKA